MCTSSARSRPRLEATRANTAPSRRTARRVRTTQRRVAWRSGHEARARRPGRVERAGDPVRVHHAHLALEPVGITEEHAQHLAEVGDELVGRAPGDQPAPDLLERLHVGRVQREVIEPAPAEHRRLAVGLGVVGHLEHVELGVRTDVDDHQPQLVLGLVRRAVDVVGRLLRAEHLAVELEEPVGVLGDHGHVVEPVGEHGILLRDDPPPTVTVRGGPAVPRIRSRRVNTSVDPSAHPSSPRSRAPRRSRRG